jgi:hypothetical protein
VLLPPTELKRYRDEFEKYKEDFKILGPKLSSKARLDLSKLDKAVDANWKKFFKIATEKNTSHLSSYKPRFDKAYADYSESVSIVYQWMLIARLEA